MEDLRTVLFLDRKASYNQTVEALALAQLEMSRFDNYESCKCRGERVIDEIVQISATRRLLRCMRCKGTIGTWDDLPDQPKTQNIVWPS